MVRFISDNRPVKVPGSGQSVPLQVVAVGLPRAATSSLQAAFERLGYTPCLHMANIVPHPAKEQLLIDAMRETDREKRFKLLHQLLDGHASVCDTPAMRFHADIMDMYPDVKVVLNGRPDPAAWAQSCNESLWFFFTPQYRLCGLLWKTDRLWYAMNMELIKWIHSVLKLNPGEHIMTAQGYVEYYELVRKEARSRGIEVLEYQAEEGWEPLCRFLGKDVPDEPFPRLNERKTFAIIKAILITRGLVSWGVLGASLWATWRYGPASLSYVAQYTKWW